MEQRNEGMATPRTVPELAPVDPAVMPSRRRSRMVRIGAAIGLVVGVTLGSAAIANAVTAPSEPAGHHEGPWPGATPPAAVGTVASVGTDAFTVTSRKGTTVSVTVDGSTTYLDKAVAAPSFHDVTVGAFVVVFGKTSSGSVAADKVIIGLPRHAMEGGGHMPWTDGPPPAAVGTVASVATGSFTITGEGGATTTVTVDGSTAYVDDAVAAPSFQDVAVGRFVIVLGSRAGGTVAATKVIVTGRHPGDDPSGPVGSSATTVPSGDEDSDGDHGAPMAPPAAAGTVATVGSGSFTVSSFHGGTVTVTVDGSTVYVGHDGASASFASIVVGARVMVLGTASSGSVAASKVFVMAPESGEPVDGPGHADGPGAPGSMWTPPTTAPSAGAPSSASTAPSASGSDGWWSGPSSGATTGSGGFGTTGGSRDTSQWGSGPSSFR